MSLPQNPQNPMDSNTDIHGGNNQLLPNATHAEQHIHLPGADDHRLLHWYSSLREEFRHDRRLEQIRDDIKAFKTKLPRTVGLKQKLTDGGFGATFYHDASRQKQQFCKKSIRYQYYESAQRIDSYLLAKVKSNFDNYVMPIIGSVSKSEVKQTIYEKVVKPIMDEINRYGVDDDYLCYTDADIYGMLYMLTGNCHINWKDYDEQ